MVAILLLGLFAEVFANNSADIEKGKRLYNANCLQCHNRDPAMKGSMGPELTSTPLEVMVAKVVTGRYPDKLPVGYVPKRKTKAMRAFPKLKDDVPAIWSYIQEFK